MISVISSILNSSGACPSATEKVAALVARATCSGASHSSDNNIIGETISFLFVITNFHILCKLYYNII